MTTGLSARAQATDLMASVVGVHDGDTITVLSAQREEIKIRLAEIDAPETGQPFGASAKKMLSDHVFGQEVRIVTTDQDRYGRTVARVYVGNLDVNRAMVEQGGAWAYRKYLRDLSIAEAEASARTAMRGLWGLQADQIEAPWDWRAKKRGRTSAVAADYDVAVESTSPPPDADPGLWEPLPDVYPYGTENAAPAPLAVTPQAAPSRPQGAGYVCGSKSTCGDMATCAEATYFLNVCGLGKLDRDKDGVPCDRLCQ